MNNDEKLNVWYNDLLVGELWRNVIVNKLNFRYDSQWLKQGFAISHQMPLHQTEYIKDETADKFFSNLLPEGQARQNCIRDLKIPDTTFDLLRAIGGECAGALSILPYDQPNIINSQYKKLTEKMFNSLILRRGNHRLKKWEKINICSLSVMIGSSKPVILNDCIKKIFARH